MARPIIRLDDRYTVISSGPKILLFDNQEHRGIEMTTELANTLQNLANMGRELAQLGATVTVTFLLPGSKAETRLDFTPPTEEIELDDDTGGPVL